MNPLPSDEITSKPGTIRWLSGTTHLAQEHRVEGNALVFGYRVDGGDFQPTCSMVFDTAEGLSHAVQVADMLRGRGQ